MANIEIRHPEYDRFYKRWRMAWDFWRGGQEVYEPNWDVATNRFPRLREDVSDDAGGENPDPERKKSYWSWGDVSPAKSYLFKHERENRRRYAERQERQIHFPFLSSIINIFVAGILRNAPVRAGYENDPWDEYHKNVDLLGTNFDSFLVQALNLALCFGRIHAVTDRPKSGDNSYSRRAQIDNEERAYSYLVTPLDVTNWLLDDRGRFVWVQIQEPVPQDRQPGEDIVPAYQYRIWYRDRWEIWRPVKENTTPNDVASRFIRDEVGYHNLGEVPISTLYATKDGRPGVMGCESPVSPALDFDRHMLNKFSEIDENERAQMWALLCIPEFEGQQTGGVDIGPFNAYTYPAEGRPPNYTSPDPQITATLQSRLEAMVHMLRQMVAIGRGRAEYSKEERSAASISLESSEKRNQMNLWAKATLEFELSITRHVAAYENVEVPPEPQYDDDFDLETVSSAIQDLLQYGAIKLEGRPDIVEMARPIVLRKLRSRGASQETITKVLDFLDEQAQTQTPEIDTFEPRQTLFRSPESAAQTRTDQGNSSNGD